MEFSPRYQAAVNTALNTCENRWTTNNEFMRDHYQHIKVQKHILYILNLVAKNHSVAIFFNRLVTVNFFIIQSVLEVSAPFSAINTTIAIILVCKILPCQNST